MSDSVTAKQALLELFRRIDTLFAEIAAEHSGEVLCRPGCIDCCHAFFDVSFAEREAIAEALAGIGDEEERHQVLLRALEARRETERLLAAARDRKGESLAPGDDLREAAGWRLRCPLLGDSKGCLVYEVRPITCRVYGLPTEIDGKGHVCGFSGFIPGGSYPTVKIQNIRESLARISQDWARHTEGGDSEARKRFFIHEVVDMAFRKG